MDLGCELVLHLLVFVLWLFGQLGSVGSDVPALNHEIGAASDKHIVFAVVDVNHIQDDILILGNHQILLQQLLLSILVATSHRCLDSQRLLA
jgi:hypothetical protein